jgi:hypothetical protein
MNKTYQFKGFTIERIDRGYYRIAKDGRLQARKRTLELAKEWIRMR